MVIADTLAGGGGDSTLGNLTAPIDYDIGKHSKNPSSLGPQGYFKSTFRY